MISKNIVKATSLLIVGIFLCAQIASVSHDHSHMEAHEHSYDHGDEDHSPEPSVCMACIVSSYEKELDFHQDFPPSPPNHFDIQSINDFAVMQLSGVSFILKRDGEDLIDPPNLRVTEPRAPPV